MLGMVYLLPDYDYNSTATAYSSEIQLMQFRPARSSGALYGSTDMAKLSQHDDVIKWKHFSRYWPFLRGIHRSPVLVNVYV